MQRQRAAQLGLSGLLVATALFGGSKAITVSPGSVTGALIADSCPTFSWGSVEAADSYDLVVYRLGEELEDAEPVVQESFPGSVSSWTPSLDLCLERGGRYAWSVRAASREAVSDWSQPRLFQVVPRATDEGSGEAVALLRQRLEKAPAAVQRTPAQDRQLAESLPPQTLVPSAAFGDADLKVNNFAVLTTATLQALYPCPCFHNPLYQEAFDPGVVATSTTCSEVTDGFQLTGGGDDSWCDLLGVPNCVWPAFKGEVEQLPNLTWSCYAWLKSYRHPAVLNLDDPKAVPDYLVEPCKQWLRIFAATRGATCSF